MTMINSADTKIIEYERVVDLKRLAFIEKNLSFLNPESHLILDVGCGNGNISRYLGNLGYRTTGVDISEKAIEKAQSLNTYQNVEFFVKNAEQLNDENRKFDAIICSEVLEHLENPLELLEAIKKILNKDGILIVTVPNGMGPREVLMTKPMQWIRKDNPKVWDVVSKIKQKLGYSGQTIQSDADNLDHIQFFTFADLKQMAETNNFDIVDHEKSDFLEDVFPFSLFTKRIKALQRLDCKMADQLPKFCAGGFHTAWRRKTEN